MTELKGIKGVVMFVDELKTIDADLHNTIILNEMIENDILITLKSKPTRTHPVRVAKKDCR